MDFFLALALYASSHNISEVDMYLAHQNYCQNLYFQPNAEKKLQEAACDIALTGAEIARVKSGRY